MNSPSVFWFCQPDLKGSDCSWNHLSVVRIHPFASVRARTLSDAITSYQLELEPPPPELPPPDELEEEPELELDEDPELPLRLPEELLDLLRTAASAL